MLNYVIRASKNEGFQTENVDQLFLNATCSCLEANTVSEKVAWLIESQFWRLTAMVENAYNGKDADHTALEFPTKGAIDLMIASVEEDLQHNYTRVIKQSEDIVCKHLLGLGNKDPKESIANILKDIEDEANTEVAE